MTLRYDLKGNTLVCDDVKVGSGETSVASAIGTEVFPAANLANPGTKAAVPDSFDKVIKISVGGTDYWIGLYADNA